MDKETIKKLYDEFLNEYDADKKDQIWQEQSKMFREFWTDFLLNDNVKELNESQIDEIVKILDKNAKGSTKEDEAVAKAMIPQGVWRRMFNEIKENKEIREKLFKIISSENDEEVISAVNHLYKINEGRKNSLTGKSANAICAMMFSYNPKRNLSVISLNSRERIIPFFGFESVDFENESPGDKIIKSNKSIIKGFKSLGIFDSPRTISCFIYWNPVIDEMRKTGQAEEEVSTPTEESEDISSTENYLFYMEKELENFLIENWDKTELGKKYELIEENGDLVSQQYRTEIGIIDILVKDKETGQYVIIELKKNQTSDDTIGQLTRYMGWLEEKKTNGEPTKGIIIAAKWDKRLHYALKKVKDVEVYLYQVDFRLNEFKQK
ncbi:hypothetical protein COV20_01490 [Candidatus Woesearchaeota archaeon CG10_big_fil_rev_8_21_14_0_10_45_16]|nr:MAG: hypothetical protein COV20_01490 [Candidatus Woesearchaeota archaeon CG10_big_fil_rev_8_21_14_0_10_45_16]